MRFGPIVHFLAVVAAGFALGDGPAVAAPETGIVPAELRRIERLVKAVEQSTDQIIRGARTR